MALTDLILWRRYGTGVKSRDFLSESAIRTAQNIEIQGILRSIMIVAAANLKSTPLQYPGGHQYFTYFKFGDGLRQKMLDAQRFGAVFILLVAGRG
jgi:hypothetical protein